METEHFQADRKRQRSARRLKHEAKAAVFTNRAGDLEGIRQKLELRPAQICDLLRVHPSAWIRWTRTGKTPPHVFQMLEWYLELQSLRQICNQTSSQTGHMATVETEIFRAPSHTTPLPGTSSEKTSFSPLVMTWILQALMFLMMLGFYVRSNSLAK